VRVKKVTLKNFRNYEYACLELHEKRNLIIGENAQGKTNFLEAVEYVCHGKSSRAQQDLDLIRKGTDQMMVEIVFESRQGQECVSFVLTKTVGARKSYDKQIKINGLTVGSARALGGRLVCVSFKSSDLNLLRGGPKDRRDWIDDILVTLTPTHQQLLGKYQKVILQRNRLLKQFFEKGRVSVSDHEQLRVWDEQLAQLGSAIIKRRLGLLHELLPYAQRHQEHISGRRETLSGQYLFRAAEKDGGDGDEDNTLERMETKALKDLAEQEIAHILLRLMKDRRAEEIARKQSLCGPHRDDIQFLLNGEDACQFASQGQQRSLVLALKLAELERVEEVLTEPPLLLLDDVLAELDMNRQGLLMSLVKDEMQTLITTTHVTGFRAEWVEGALFLEVAGGSISAVKETQAVI